MREYKQDLRDALERLYAEDPDMKVSDTNYAQRLLRRSGLTVTGRRSVLAAAGAKWDVSAIEDALEIMFGNAHLNDKARRTDMVKKHHARKDGQKPHKKPWSKHGKGKGKGGKKSYLEGADDDSDEDSIDAPSPVRFTSQYKQACLGRAIDIVVM